MSVLGKLRSSLQLVARGDWRAFQRQCLVNYGNFLLRRRGPAPFAHQRMGFPVVCHPDWPDSRDQFCLSDGDHWEFRLLQAWLQPGEQCVDLGANLGLYSFAALAVVGAAGRVVAVDAGPAVTEKLSVSARVLGAGHLQVVHAAILDAPGEVDFFVIPSGASTGEQSVRPSEARREQSVKLTVPALTLAELQRTQALDQRLGLIKMDIEGAEELALRGAPPAWFGRDGPLWMVEINPEALQRFGSSPAEIIAHFPAEAFDRWLLPKHCHDPQARPSVQRLDTHTRFDDAVYYNFFAIPRGTRRARLAGLLPAN